MNPTHAVGGDGLRVMWFNLRSDVHSVHPHDAASTYMCVCTVCTVYTLYVHTRVLYVRMCDTVIMHCMLGVVFV